MKHATLVTLWIALAGLAAAQTAKIITPADVFRRNTEPRDQANIQFPPHKVTGNLYYVGSPILSSFLITTPEGHILINSAYEATVPAIRASIEQLGFRMSDVKILLGSHAHGDHMEGDALVKELSGAQVMAMEQDVPALQKIMPGGKPHPIDKVLHDGDHVTLGGTTLVAHLTPGHTRGCTTWTLKVQDGGKTYDVVIVGSVGVNPGFILVNNKDVPQIADEYRHSFRILRSLPCDIPLGSHPAMYGMAEKYAKLGKGPNPFIDPQGYKTEVNLMEQVFNTEVARQQKEAPGH
jgi:metallo-beta-lactamase class B